MSAPINTIRLASLEDIPTIQNLANEIWHAVYPGIISTKQINYMLRWMYAEEQIRQDMVEAGAKYFLLKFEQKPIGFGAFGPDEETPTAKLHKLYLKPNYHGRGLGTRLLLHIEAEAEQQGFVKIRLQVNKNNTGAIKAYHRNGYKTEREAIFDIGDGYVMDDFIMVKNLIA